MKKLIHTDLAPAAIGPYSQAIEINGMLFISGQIAIDPSTGELIKAGIQEQTELILKNIGAILQQAGYTYDHVVKTTVMLADMHYFTSMNEVYARFYKDIRPARSTFAAKDLPREALVEIETIAVK
jgi:2-iminobutanoate/2-iminopropanoate deaminase